MLDLNNPAAKQRKGTTDPAEVFPDGYCSDVSTVQGSTSVCVRVLRIVALRGLMLGHEENSFL